MELTALCTALVLGLCLLVNNVSRVEGVGRALVEAIRPDRPPPKPRPHRQRAPRPSKPRPARAPRCYCPTDIQRVARLVGRASG
jgi:hypothetical protein